MFIHVSNYKGSTPRSCRESIGRCTPQLLCAIRFAPGCSHSSSYRLRHKFFTWPKSLGFAVCAKNRITWLFNPPGAPWMGGVWERLVGSVKSAFQQSVGRKRLSYSDMLTVVTRIEAIVNTRPLTAISTADIVLSHYGQLISAGKYQLFAAFLKLRHRGRR